MATNYISQYDLASVMTTVLTALSQNPTLCKDSRLWADSRLNVESLDGLAIEEFYEKHAQELGISERNGQRLQDFFADLRLTTPMEHLEELREAYSHILEPEDPTYLQVIAHQRAEALKPPRNSIRFEAEYANQLLALEPFEQSRRT